MNQQGAVASRCGSVLRVRAGQDTDAGLKNDGIRLGRLSVHGCAVCLEQKTQLGMHGVGSRGEWNKGAQHASDTCNRRCGRRVGHRWLALAGNKLLAQGLSLR